MIYLFDSPFGPISYAWHDDVCQAVWLQRDEAVEAVQDDPVSQWLKAYFSGQAMPLPALAKPASAFQQKMRRGLLTIPFGEVRCYGQLARQLGTSARGLGQALGANALPVLIPCHRVIAVSGLGGFSCGLKWKQTLLQFENDLSTV